ncbi:MAG TPA: DUF1996 domain-containing protein [Acidimicrobiia bacterium]|nr:DUF1996 domain-containing protein [Acidimicrobiia bacterium]
MTDRRTTMPLALAVLLVVLLASCKPVVPPPSRSSTELGSVRVECLPSHRAMVDPIVSWGQESAHVHDFFGNVSTNATSTYETMRDGGSSCSDPGDTAGYWIPSLVAPDGRFVQPERAIFYYRNRPVEYSRTVPFRSNFRMIAGGTFPNTYWTCDGESDTGFEDRRDFIPNCGPGRQIKVHVFFPSCWDGRRIDSADHRSHVTYGRDEDDGRVDGTDPDVCPRTHPVKIPQLDFRVLYPVSDGRGYRFSDGALLPHSDFWNTWQRERLMHWVDSCLGYEGRSCGLATEDR